MKIENKIKLKSIVFKPDKYYIAYIIHIDFKTNTCFLEYLGLI